MVKPALDVELVLDTRAELGEAPLWDSVTQTLLWVDYRRRLVHRYDPCTGTNESCDVMQFVTATGLRDGGGLILALHHGVGLLEDGFARLVTAIDEPGNRLNDGKVAPDGRFWVGTMAFDGSVGAGSLYRVDADWHATRVLADISISNGLDWTSDCRVMYYVDSKTQGVDAFDYDPENGSISRRRRVLTIPAEDGVPDGLTLDADGCIWLALWGGWCVRQYSPTGQLMCEVKLPVRHVTNCGFGGKDGGDLYITSASVRLPDPELAEQPHAGGLFRCRPGATGRPANLFKGDSPKGSKRVE